MRQTHRWIRRTSAQVVLGCALILGTVGSGGAQAGGGFDGSGLPGGEDAGAQTSTVTGRHAPVSVDPGPSRLRVTAGAGVLTSGDLFKVEVVSRNPQPWLSPAGSQFNSEEFIVTLDEDLLLSASLIYRLVGQWWLRGDLSYAKLDATAEALVGQTVELHLYDQLDFLMAGLTVERPLVSTPSYPFLLAGLAWVDIKAENEAAFDQSDLGWRLGGGYHQQFATSWGLRLEIRDTILQIDTLQHQPLNLNPQEPELKIEQYGPQHLFELALLIQKVF